MVKFAANLTMMFNEVEFLRRFSLAAASGFKAVEFLFPYPYTADQLKALLEDNRLELVLHNSPAGDWQAGERGIACLPDRTGEFRDGVSQAIEYAKTLGCKRLNSLAGIAPLTDATKRRYSRIFCLLSSGFCRRRRSLWHSYYQVLLLASLAGSRCSES